MKAQRDFSLCAFFCGFRKKVLFLHQTFNSCKLCQNSLKVKYTLRGGVKTALIIFAVLLTAAVGKKLANYEPSVSIAETDSEAKNWEITKGSNGNYNLKYSGNSRVKSLKAIQLVDLGIIVDGKKIMFSTTDAASKSWTEIENKTALPSQAEWQALQDNCYWERGTKDGLDGYYVYKKKANGTYSTDTDNYIFLSDGDYWSGTESGDNAYCTTIADENINPSAEKTATSVLPFRLIKRKSEYVSVESFAVIALNKTKTLTVTNTSGKTITWKSSDETVATVDGNGKVTGKKEGTAKISAYFDGDISTCEVKVINPVFTVSAEGKKVIFSSGNLQYHCKNKEWRFAENQYDFIGDANENIAENYDGWIDLFGWGMWLVGQTPTQSSTDNSDYLPTIEERGQNFSETSAIGSKWITLTTDEWAYLVATKCLNDSKLGITIVNGIQGLVILPDDWILPNGVTFESNTFEESYTFEEIFTAEAKNEYNIANWKIMESAGAVFLPYAGMRSTTGGNKFSNSIFYWLATAYSNTNAYSMFWADVWPDSRSRGYPVRLVRVAE